MEVRRIFVFLLLIFSVAAVLSSDEPVDLSKLICDTPACDMVAEMGDYEAYKLEHTIKLKTDAFSLQVPDEPLNKIIALEDEIILFYKDGQRLLIAEDSGPDVGELKNVKVNQFPQIVFTKTTKDEEPESHSDRFFWKVALYQKPAFFNQASEVSYAEKDGVSYFLSNSNELGFSGSAMVSAENVKDRFLRIKAMNMEYGKFRKIASNVVVEK
ncbi:MAG: hypothetical protein KZQ93_12265 [Candidatus Thiodiazotropha sp. (ex Monitilora ramsayi)]|nr:hypothetical protein [Candidatus Thiodiazotropha sp. (ex Monitilora ramsayi)]